MKEIFSKQNKLIKDLKKQKRTNKFVLFLDNPKSITDAQVFGLTPKMLLIDKEKQEKFSHLPLCENTVITNKEIIKELSDTVTPQGVVAVYDFVLPKLQQPKGNFLVLDGLQDAGNIGTLLRSALGANFTSVFLVDCAAVNNSKIIRSSMSAILRLNIHETTRAEFVKFVNRNNLMLASCDMNGQNIYTSSSTLNSLGLVVGSEGAGVSEELKNLCKLTFSIPMANNLESLNAAVAGSIIMFQIENQKKGS